MYPDNRPNYIDLFAGAGGISLGLYKAGWSGLFAIEKSEMAFKTLKHNLIHKKNHFNWPKWLPQTNMDIINVVKYYRSQLEYLKGKIDLVTGGPPCQGFSFAGKRNRQDERNYLINLYIEFINIVKPRILFLENVKGFTVGFKNNEVIEQAYSDYVKEKLQDMGYNVNGWMFNFSDFGIPQNRERFILIGLQKGDPVSLYKKKMYEKKKKFLNKKGLKENNILKEAISDLERKHGVINSCDTKYFKEGLYGEITSSYQRIMRKNSPLLCPDSHRFANHKNSTVKKMNYILNNCPKNVRINNNIKKMFNLKKQNIIPLSPNEPVPTLTTLPDDYIHYSEPRILTVREYARIQSFEDWYEFKSKYTTGGQQRKFEVPRYSQVANAVPPLFMELTGIVLKEF